MKLLITLLIFGVLVQSTIQQCCGGCGCNGNNPGNNEIIGLLYQILNYVSITTTTAYPWYPYPCTPYYYTTYWTTTTAYPWSTTSTTTYIPHCTIPWTTTEAPCITDYPTFPTNYPAWSTNYPAWSTNYPAWSTSSPTYRTSTPAAWRGTTTASG